MKYFTTIVSETVAKYQRLITVIFLVLIFTIASVIFYFRVFKKSKYNTSSENKSFSDISNINNKNNKNNKNNTMKNNGTIQFYYFYVEWCPYCTKSLPIYRSFKDKYNSINEKQIEHYEINLTNDTDPANKNYITKYNIDSYPTIFIINENGDRIDFKSSATLSNLDKFINSV